MSARFPDHRFLTYKQAIALGGYVNRGEKGFPVVLWSFEHDKEIHNAKPKVFTRSYTLFNVCQCANVDLQDLKRLNLNDDPLRSAAEVIDAYKNGPVIRNGGNSAFYRP
jgi:antirestriction protein ArdC